MDIHESDQQASRKLNQEFLRSLDRERNEAQKLAELLSRNAGRQWRKAIEGAVALPAAIATDVAAITLRMVAFVTSSLEAIQQSTQMGRALYGTDDEHRVPRNLSYESHDRLIASDDQQSRSTETPHHS